MYNQKNYDAAIDWFKKAVNAPYADGENSDGLIFNNIATAYTKINRLDLATAFYEGAISEGLVNENILLSLASTYLKDEVYYKAIATYEKIIKLYPSSGKAYFLRGKCYKLIGRFFEGDSDLQKAISLNYYG